MAYTPQAVVGKPPRGPCRPATLHIHYHLRAAHTEIIMSCPHSQRHHPLTPGRAAATQQMGNGRNRGVIYLQQDGRGIKSRWGSVFMLTGEGLCQQRSGAVCHPSVHQICNRDGRALVGDRFLPERRDSVPWRDVTRERHAARGRHRSRGVHSRCPVTAGP